MIPLLDAFGAETGSTLCVCVVLQMCSWLSQLCTLQCAGVITIGTAKTASLISQFLWQAQMACS